jgi:type II secretory pathway predicted ATPase ExeA
MFLDFYNLREDPFGVTPDPAYLYASRTHSEALNSLREGILAGRGFLTLIAEPGMGKTTVLYQLLESLPETTRTAFMFQTQCNSQEFFQYLLSELGVDTTSMGLVAMHNKLNAMLFEEMLAGKRFVLIVDEAQNLDDSTLETIRLLSNFETSHSKLLQIVLAGQSQLGEKLKQKQLAQLLQRITVVKHLEPLSAHETTAYIRHRLQVAGYSGEPLFEPAALTLVHKLSQGIPRNINKISHGALSEAYDAKRYTVSPEMVEKADRKLDVFGPSTPLAPAPLSTLPKPKNDEAARSGESTATGFIFDPPVGVKPRGKLIWAGALAALLLSAGLFVLRTELKDVGRRLRDQITLIAGSSRHNVADGDRKIPAATGSTDNEKSIGPGSPDASVVASTSAPFNLLGKANRIVIDPGHGGQDSGAKGPHGQLEKNVCLEVALRLGQLIEENIPGAEVVYTRTDDSFLSLQERTAIANRSQGVLLISIHANADSGGGFHNAETYYLSVTGSPESLKVSRRENGNTQLSTYDLRRLLKKSAQNDKVVDSKALAAEIQKSLSQQLQPGDKRDSNAGVGQGPFVVLAGAQMPAVVSEFSFVTNTGEVSTPLDSDQRQHVAEGLYRGIATYLGGSQGSSQNPQKLANENFSETSSQLAVSTARLPQTSH